MPALKLMRTDEDDLIAQAAAGDHGAFGTLVDLHGARIHRLMSRFTRDPGELEDLTQEVFVKVFRKLGTFQRDSAFYTWLYRIAVNTATDYLSRQRRRRLHLVETDAELEAVRTHERTAGSATPLLEEEVRRVTREVLGTLPEKYRTILILREFEDLSYTDMASVLQCSMGTVESRLFRARQRFKEALERQYPDLVPQFAAVKPRGGMSPR
ncbi:MAG: sigma-70 family RNA polymerase sigma factor [Planctomycetota bacterium]